jgi:hypothetical protein
VSIFAADQGSALSRPERVRLRRCQDMVISLPPGLEGTVVARDDAGTVHVLWDNGARLGLIPGIDEWEELAEGA